MQEASGAIALFRQVLAAAKAPVTAGRDSRSGAAPELVTLTTSVALRLSTACDGKMSELTLSAMAG